MRECCIVKLQKEPFFIRIDKYTILMEVILYLLESKSKKRQK